MFSSLISWTLWSTFQSWDWWCTKGKGKVNRCINLIWKVYLLSSPLGHTFLSKVNLSWPKWRQEIPYSLTVHQKFIRKMWWANNGLVEGFNLQLPDYLSLFEIYWGAGERILKVTKKSGNRGRCRKLSLWSSTHRATFLCNWIMVDGPVKAGTSSSSSDSAGRLKVKK